MRAALHTAYGPADLLQVTDVEKPVPKQQQVLIKIRATMVSTGDCNIRNLTFVPHSMPEDASLAIKPAPLSWEDAVAIPFGANTALYYLRDVGKVRAGQELLVLGASGSIGTAAVQLGKHFGAA